MAVVRGDLRAYTAAHPADPVLVVEIALSSLALDREHKASLYARAGRPEYWILNLMERVLEVYRDPVPSQNASYGWDYLVSRTRTDAPLEHVKPGPCGQRFRLPEA